VLAAYKDQNLTIRNLCPFCKEFSKDVTIGSHYSVSHAAPAPTADILQAFETVNNKLDELIREMKRDGLLEIWDLGSNSVRSKRDQGAFKTKALEYYERKYDDGKLQCMISQEWLPSHLVTASHIFPHSKPAVLLEKYDIKPSMHESPRNCLLLAEQVEKAFDRCQLCFIYNPFKQQFFCHLLDVAILDSKIASCSHITFRALEGKPLVPGPKENLLPCRRLLALHALASFQRNNLTQQQRDELSVFLNLSEPLSDDGEGWFAKNKDLPRAKRKALLKRSTSRAFVIQYWGKSVDDLKERVAELLPPAAAEPRKSKKQKQKLQDKKDRKRLRNEDEAAVPLAFQPPQKLQKQTPLAGSTLTKSEKQRIRKKKQKQKTHAAAAT